MLQSTGSQRISHDWATEQQEKIFANDVSDKRLESGIYKGHIQHTTPTTMFKKITEIKIGQKT